MSLTKTGIPAPEQIKAIKPSRKRLAAGPVVVVECFEEIPCDPCHTSCKQGCFLPFEDINDLPSMNFDLCNGCGVCLGACPGLAIFIVDESYSDDQALVQIPWEFQPLPRPGQTVRGLNRAGEEVAVVRVEKVRPAGKNKKTIILSLAVPKELAFEIRSIKIED